MSSPFAHIEQAPPDPIIGLTEAFNNDSNPAKVNLGVGVYQDATGKVPVLNVVREAEKRFYESENTKSYLPIDGLPAYNKAVQQLLFGADSQVLAEGRAVTVQGLGGTGSLKIGADFVRRFLPDLMNRVLQGKIKPGRVFDLELPIARVAEGYAAMDERRAIKVLLRP